jgi:hypothetical protein
MLNVKEDKKRDSSDDVISIPPYLVILPQAHFEVTDKNGILEKALNCDTIT